MITAMISAAVCATNPAFAMEDKDNGRGAQKNNTKICSCKEYS